MSSGTTISIAMCTYNGEKYLPEQLRTIASQTRLPTELVVCDDRSTDRTMEILNEFAASAPFAVHIHLNEQNLGSSSRGITHNFEKAVGLCAGQLIVTCDQDDIWMPQKLARMAALMDADPRLGAVFSDAQLVTPDGKPKGTKLSQATGFSPEEQQQLARGEALPIVVVGNRIYGCTLMFRGSLLDKILPVPPHWWFDAWVGCVAAVYMRLSFTSEELVHYRIHPSQSIGAHVQTFSQKVEYWRSSQRKYWEDYSPQLTELHDKLEAEHDDRFSEDMAYLQGRNDLLRFRAELAGNPLSRRLQILQNASSYFRYLNGWRSITKDLVF